MADYSRELEDLRRAEDNEAVTGAWCEIIVAFNIAHAETYFMLNTVITYKDGLRDETGTPIDPDPDTAEYFKTEALKHIAQNFEVMKQCKAELPAVVA